jgi:pimeloyl-ACP methyl ester carboxylesterase
VLAGVAALALLTPLACSAVPSASDVKDTSAPVPGGVGSKNGAGMPTAPERYYTQKVNWQPCTEASRNQCALIEVPMDYSKPEASIKLRVLRVRVRSTDQRRGSLVVNPGGPGGSGIQYAAAAGQVLTPAILESYDIIGFDPRGVGEPDRIACLDDPAMETWLSMDDTPDTAAEETRWRDVLSGIGKACAKNSGSLLGHVSTLEAAADMDILRSILGEEKLDFLGKSYGTLLGAAYAQEFPKSVGQMVLDGALPGPADDDSQAKEQAGGFETALDAFLADCVKQVCPLGSTKSAAHRELNTFLQGLDSKPLPTLLGRDLTQQLGQTGLAQALYSKALWPQLRSVLDAALDGDGSGLLQLADAYAGREKDSYRDSILTPNLAINCVDQDSDTTVSNIKRLLPSFRKASPTFGETVAWAGLACSDWPVRQQFPWVPLTAEGAAPIVVVGTTRDPATPYAWSKELASTLDSGVLLTREGDGHTGYHEGNACVDAAVDAYLLDGTVPAVGTVCK